MSNNYSLENITLTSVEEISDLLKAYALGKYSEDLVTDGLRICYNSDYGIVYLQNNLGQIFKLNGDKLEEFFYLPVSSHEGFVEDLYAEFKNGNIDDIEDLIYLVEILVNSNREDEANAVRAKVKEIEEIEYA